jgi:hypothetical protein
MNVISNPLKEWTIVVRIHMISIQLYNYFCDRYTHITFNIGIIKIRQMLLASGFIIVPELIK